MDKLEQMLEHQQRLNDIIRSSELITDAVSATLWKYGDPPSLGMVTFVDGTYYTEEKKKIEHAS